MALTVNTNVTSLNAQRNLNASNSALQTTLQRLSTGSKINSAKDDAAGLQISNRLTSQINGLGVAVNNANDGISISQTAEGALQQSTSILQRMRDLALQSANGSNTSAERTALNDETSELKKELDRISNTTTFGGQKLLDGTFGTKTFQVGSSANETISVKINSSDSQSLTGNYYDTTSAVTVGSGAATSSGSLTVSGTVDGKDFSVSVTYASGDTGADINQSIATAINDANIGVGAFVSGGTGSGASGAIELVSAVSSGGSSNALSSFGVSGTVAGVSITSGTIATTATSGSVATIDLKSQSGAQEALSIIDSALSTIDKQRSSLGAIQNRFDNTISNLQNISENVTSAKSRITDTDFAKETANMTKYQVLQQAGTAVLAQAKALPQTVLSLLQ